jgi:hypothetical protein
LAAIRKILISVMQEAVLEVEMPATAKCGQSSTPSPRVNGTSPRASSARH